MENIKRILVVSRVTKESQEAIRLGVSLSKKYGAELYVLHIIHNPFGLDGWNIPVPSPEKEYEKILQKTKKELDALVASEKKRGLSINDFIKEGEPVKEILKVVKEKNIDLMIMLTHEQGRLEHFLFARGTDEIIRKMPCSVLLLKKEPRTS
ncbi:MAG: universal stress protein [Nitrospirae bacterium RBG_13_39_12]|nr:MAG: universal stress protein [Nitrospirae bacterium RBG_13_39_12]